MKRKLAVAVALCGLLAACQPGGNQGRGAPDAEAARQFIASAEEQLAANREEENRASWIAANFITYDSQYLQTRNDERSKLLAVRLAKEAVRYKKTEVTPEERRKLDLLESGLTMPTPDDPAKAHELADIGSRLEARYGEGKYCPPGRDECLNLDDMSRVMRTSHDATELLDLWRGWREVSPPMRSDYVRQVEIANEGARSVGYKDVADLWKSRYDMPADEFGADMDRQWETMKPLYTSLHCYVRTRLNQFYGDDVVQKDGPIPAHLLGNMWAQEWQNVYDLVAPPSTGAEYSLTDNIVAKGLTELDMVRQAEHFFVSLGFEPLPDTFWTRSLFVRPRDREVVCHASAWDLDGRDDIRVKMCLERTGEDFETIHHELGHNFYQRAYKDQPILFQGGANDGFHEAMGDTIALSITPEYLVKIGLLDAAPAASNDIPFLLQGALSRVAFIPFGLLVDKWRWGVFDGSIPPDRYNTAWWELREKYQGVRAPLPRSEADFDPGAKYHIAANVPYARYFLGYILQYQFHRALCQLSGDSGPLHRCSIYESREAGNRLRVLMEMGRSRPWQDALEVIAGTRDLDSSAILDYYAPLKSWLDEQNRESDCGW